FNLQGYIDHQKEHAHADQYHADSKQTSQLLTDCCKHIVLLYKRNHLRRSLAQSHAEPSACPDGKQPLDDLISRCLINRKRIPPRYHSLFYMRKQEIGDHCSTAAASKTCKKIYRFFGGHIQHHHVSNKENNRAP